MGVVGGSEAAAPPFRPHQGKAEHTSLRLHSLVCCKTKQKKWKIMKKDVMTTVDK